MNRMLSRSVPAVLAAVIGWSAGAFPADFRGGLIAGKPDIRSMSTLAFGPDGVPYTARAGSSVQHIDNFSDKGIAGLQRMPSGRMDLVIDSVERMAH